VLGWSPIRGVLPNVKIDLWVQKLKFWTETGHKWPTSWRRMMMMMMNYEFYALFYFIHLHYDYHLPFWCHVNTYKFLNKELGNTQAPNWGWGVNVKLSIVKLFQSDLRSSLYQLKLQRIINNNKDVLVVYLWTHEWCSILALTSQIRLHEQCMHSCIKTPPYLINLYYEREWFCDIESLLLERCGCCVGGSHSNLQKHLFYLSSGCNIRMWMLGNQWNKSYTSHCIMHIWLWGVPCSHHAGSRSSSWSSK